MLRTGRRMARSPYPSLRDQYGLPPAGYSDDDWFAVAPDHVVRMGTDWEDDRPINIGLCRCGKEFRVPRDGGGLEGALKREADMDALIAAHHAEVMRGRSPSRSSGGLERKERAS